MSLSNKQSIFLKRTISLLFPIPVSLVGLKSFSDYSYSILNLPLSFSDSQSSANSLKTLDLQLLSAIDYPPGLEDYGSMLIYKPNSYSPSYQIEQLSPFISSHFNSDFRFKRANLPQPSLPSSLVDENIKFTSDKSTSNNSYSFSLADFKNSSIKDKSDLHIIFEYDYQLPNSKKIPLISSIPLKPIIYSSNVTYPLITVDSQSSLNLVSSSPKTPSKTTYYLELQKYSSTKKLKLSLTKNQQSTKASADNLKVKNFYILFTDNPSYDLSRYFSDPDSINSILHSHPGKQYHLDSWKLNAQTSANSPNFKFKNPSSRWLSLCWDPYKAGGFIDKDLTKVDPHPSTSQSTSSSFKTKSFIKKQKEQVELFQPQLIHPTIKTQYSWQSQSGINPYHDYHPIIQHTTPTPCEGVDKDTYNLLKKYLIQSNRFKEGLNSQYSVNKSLIPPELKQLINKSTEPYTTDGNKNYRIVQGSFIPFGGVYASDSAGYSKHIKAETQYNPLIVDSINSSHRISFSIDKSTWHKYLIEHKDLKKLNGSLDSSSLLGLNVPISFQIYDPINNYLNKERLNLYIDLDLRNLYNAPEFSKKFYTYSISENHKERGIDWGGYRINDSNETNKRPYGYRGKVEFSAGLEIDLDDNLIISISAKISGFISTKNPTCDLRHRLTQIYPDDPSKQKCSSNPNWAYRDYNHIPPFFIFSVNKDIKLDSWIVTQRYNSLDLNSKSNHNLLSLKNKWTKQIRTKYSNLSQNQNSEVYYENINAADLTTYESDSKFTRVAPYSQWKSVSSGGYWYAYYYIPRKNYGSFVIENQSGLDNLTLTLEGSSSLSGKFFNSFHNRTTVTYCTSELSSDKNPSNSQDCGDGQKYEKIEKDKNYNEFSFNINFLKIKSNFSDLKKKTTEQDPITFNFLTLIHRETNDDNKFDNQKSKYEAIFSESSSPSTISSSQTVAEHSHIGAWYSINLWWDQSKSTINYYTYLRVISVLSGVSDWKNAVSENQTTHKLPGSAGAAGFQIKEISAEYIKNR